MTERFQFNHLEADDEGRIEIRFFTATGRARRMPLSRHELAKLVTDIGVVMTLDARRATMKAGETP